MITINIENTIENCMILLLFAFAYVIITTGIAKVTTRNDKESMTVAWVIGLILYIITVAAFIIIK